MNQVDLCSIAITKINIIIYYKILTISAWMKLYSSYLLEAPFLIKQTVGVAQILPVIAGSLLLPLILQRERERARERT